jgi:hypothetical protein
MKRILIAATLLASVQSFAQQNIKSIEIGSNIPMQGVEVKTSAGTITSLDKAKTAKGLLVMFSCNTCPYVIKSQARTKEMMAYTMQNGIGMVVVNSNEAKREDDDSYKAMAAYAKEQGYKVPYLVDTKSTLADAFGATRTPETFLFDANGKLVYKGAMEDNPQNPTESKELFLKAAIDNMIAGKTIEPNATKSIGCTIKRAM